MISQGKIALFGGKMSQYQLSPTDLSWYDLESNTGHRGKRPTTNHLNYGTALLRQKLIYFI